MAHLFVNIVLREILIEIEGRNANDFAAQICSSNNDSRLGMHSRERMHLAAEYTKYDDKSGLTEPIDHLILPFNNGLPPANAYVGRSIRGRTG